MPSSTLTAGEAASLLGVSPTTIRSYVRRKHINGTKRGRDWFFTRAEVERVRANPPQRTGRPKRPT